MTAIRTPRSASDSRRIVELVMRYRSSKILLVATDLDVFTAIGNKRRTLSQICFKIKTHPRTTRILLDALVPLGFLTKTGDAYANTSISRRALIKDSPGYIGNNLKYQELVWKAWSGLKGTVQDGETAHPLEYWLSKHKTFSREYILGMHNIAQGPAREVANIPLSRYPARILDMGAGPGTFSLAFLDRYPSLKASLLDLPGTIRIAKDVIPERFRPRVSFIPGNYHTVDPGDGRFDVVLMSHITHNEGPQENKRLLKKAFRALKPGGSVIVHDFMLDDSKTSPVFGALFSVHMLATTRRGEVYSTREYRSWIAGTGFNRIRQRAIAPKSTNASTAIVAERRL